MNLHDKKKAAFDKIAKLYDKVRLSPPNEAVAWIISESNLCGEDTILEIGSGTGQATVLFAEAGFKVYCIELGANLASILKANCRAYPGVTIDVSAFEKWEPLGKKSFPLIISVQAFHWLDTTIKYKKCHSLLRSNGYLSLIWTGWSNSNNEVVERFNDIDVPGHEDTPLSDHGDLNHQRKMELEQSGYFTNIKYKIFPWTVSYQPNDFLKLLQTDCAYLMVGKEDQKLITESIQKKLISIEKKIDIQLETIVFLASPQKKKNKYSFRDLENLNSTILGTKNI